MKQLLTILFTLTSLGCVFGQANPSDSIKNDGSNQGVFFRESDTLLLHTPLPIGLNEENFPKELLNLINHSNFVNPETVYLRFSISKTGELTKIAVLRGKNQDCINESLRIIRSFKKWSPAQFSYKGHLFYGECELTIPFQFKN